MRYVSRESNGGFNLVKYEDYLEQDRISLSSLIQGAELLRIERFVPTGPGSFHDARFDQLFVNTCDSSHADSKARGLRVELRLRGPYFDRYFELHYDDVSSLEVELPAPDDDLLMHEVRREGSSLVHELHFDRGKTIEVRCRGLRFVEIPGAETAARQARP